MFCRQGLLLLYKNWKIQSDNRWPQTGGRHCQTACYIYGLDQFSVSCHDRYKLGKSSRANANRKQAKTKRSTSFLSFILHLNCDKNMTINRYYRSQRAFFFFCAIICTGNLRNFDEVCNGSYSDKRFGKIFWYCAGI